MAANDFVEVATIRNLDSEKFVPIVDEDTLYMPNKNLRALSAYNIAKKAGKVKIGDLKIKVLNERRFEDRATITTAQAAADVALVLNSTAMIKAGYDLYDINSNQQIHVTSVTNGTTLVVAALTAAVTAGSVIAILGRSVTDNWTASDPIARATGYHYDYASLVQESMAFSWGLKYRTAYIQSESVRIPRQFQDEFDIKLNARAWFGVGKDGTSGSDNAYSGLYEMQGLVPQGIAFNLIECPGAITPDILNRGAQILANEGNATGRLELCMAPSLLNLFALWPFGAGLIRLMGLSNTEYGLGGLTNVNTPVKGLTGFNPTCDQALEKPGFNNIMALINWDDIKGIGFGEDYLQRDIQPLGSGQYKTQLTRSIGFEYGIQAGAVVVFTNVNAFVV